MYMLVPLNRATTRLGSCPRLYGTKCQIKSCPRFRYGRSRMRQLQYWASGPLVALLAARSAVRFPGGRAGTEHRLLHVAPARQGCM